MSLTPLIDVVFILLVFFMLVTQFTDWRALEVDISAGGKAGAGDRAALQVTAVTEGYRWQGDVRPLDEVVDAIAAARSDAAQPVYVGATDGVALQRTVTLVSALREAGVEPVRWAQPASP